MAQVFVLEKVGFFHFGCNHRDPILSLANALTAKSGSEGVSGSLIVLPEGFNLRKWYKDKEQRCCWNRAVVSELQEVCAQFSVVFVAGLIIDEGNGICPPYSSAVLVDGSSFTRVCYKHDSDDMARSNYTPCEAGCDIHNPVLYENTCVGAVICMDVQKRSYPLLRSLAGYNGVYRIMCIPACMNRHYFGGGPCGHQVSYGGLTEVITVLANSDSKGCNSFITDTLGKIVRIQSNSDENEVVLRPLVDCRTVAPGSAN